MILCFLFTCLLIFLLFKKEPMLLLLSTMCFMLMMISSLFMDTLDYWTMFIMILSFLVGLFLMFMYMVSLSKKGNTFSTDETIMKNNTVALAAFMFIITFMPSLSTITQFFDNISSFSWYEKWMQEKTEIMVFFIIAFFFLIMLMFYMMKKAKKNMKSSS